MKKQKLNSVFVRRSRLLNLFLLLFLVFLLVLLRLQQSASADANNPPICQELQASPVSGGAQLTVYFIGRGSIQDGEITQARFTFGDKAEDIRIEDFGQAMQVSTSHLYKLPGTYTANLYLTSDRGVVTGEIKDCQVRISVEGEVLPAEKI